MSTPKRILWTGTLLLGVLLTGVFVALSQEEMPITTSSPEARQLFIQARDLSENMEFTKAAAVVDQALQKDPDFALAYLLRAGLGESYDAALKDRQKAEELLGKVTEGERIRITGSNAGFNGQSAKAKEAMESLLQKFPGDKHLQNLAGRFYTNAGDFSKALPYFEQAVKLDPKYAAPYNNLGYGNAALGNKDAAEKAFKTYIDLLPQSPNPHDSYAEFLRMNGRYDESIAQYQKVLQMDPSFTASILGIGDNYLKKGEYKKALEQYQMYVDKTPEIPLKFAGYDKHAAVHVIQGNLPEALAALEQLKTLALKQKQNATAVYYLGSQGYLLSALGKPQEGMKKLQEAIGLAKKLDMPDATRENLLANAGLEVAYSYLEAKNLKKAEAQLSASQKELAQLNDEGMTNFYTRLEGCLAIGQGHYEEAITKLTSVPEDPFSLHALTIAYTKNGDKNKAQAALDKLNRWQAVNLDWAIQQRQATLNHGI